MRTPISLRKRHLTLFTRTIRILEVLISLIIAMMASIYVGTRYYNTFDDVNTRIVCLVLVALTGFLSYVTLMITTSWWNNKVLESVFQKKTRKSSPQAKKTGPLETTVTCSDSFINKFVKKLETSPVHLKNNYKTVVNETFPHQFRFQTTGMDQPTSQNAEELNAEFIKKRLLEKETRIMEVVDINIARNPDHMYDFSAMIYVSANSLLKAADIVDSANSILEDDFNIKDTRLIPIIYK